MIYIFVKGVKFMKYRKLIFFALITLLICANILSAQNSPNRVGTTVSNFLELGYDPKGIAMGEACVSTVNDLSSIYWNPAGLAFMQKNEMFFAYQPWLVGTQTYIASAGLVVPSIGTFAACVMGINYGEMEVTTMELQEGTGEIYTPTDLAISFSYGRRLTSWFGFGATAKYVHSSIFHSSANAIAADFGVIINTGYFSPTDKKDGMRIGMCLSNYGTRMKYGGLDMLRSVDISPDEAGNYKDIKVEYKTDSWELPLIFRIGISVNPIVTTVHRLTLAADALHANNNNESVNIGVKYTLSIPGIAKLFLRGGYRSIFLEDSEFGPTFGVGILLHFMHQKGIQFDYAYRNIGILGDANVMGLSFLF
ncbi:MAG: PorV/PorQ family protein [Candidatus Marinimicrobia bacterium]|nr:PorV/PorQ family protein [Candidatus Neomarinimicrobiota bacterium]